MKETSLPLPSTVWDLQGCVERLSVTWRLGVQILTLLGGVIWQENLSEPVLSSVKWGREIPAQLQGVRRMEQAS